MSLSGMNLAGANPARGRAEHDYYATNPEAVRMLVNRHPLPSGKVLEPCVGGGNIVEALKTCTNNNDYTCIDIVDRGYPNTIITDFLTWNTDKRFDLIITNPPFSKAVEFIEKGYNLLTPHGQMIMFMKIQFLEGIKRKEFFKKYPIKYVYVFPNRMSTWMNGMEHDPVTGKKWVTTFCNAWFVWKKNSDTETILRWL